MQVNRNKRDQLPVECMRMFSLDAVVWLGSSNIEDRIISFHSISFSFFFKRILLLLFRRWEWKLWPSESFFFQHLFGLTEDFYWLTKYSIIWEGQTEIETIDVNQYAHCASHRDGIECREPIKLIYSCLNGLDENLWINLLFKILMISVRF